MLGKIQYLSIVVNWTNFKCLFTVNSI